jgi:hypothetical protein
MSGILPGHRGRRGIGAKQCSIVVGDDLSTWLRDYISTHRTAVGHNRQNQGRAEEIYMDGICA